MSLTLSWMLYDNIHIQKILKLLIAGVQAEFQMQVLLSFSVVNEEKYVLKIVEKLLKTKNLINNVTFIVNLKQY